MYYQRCDVGVNRPGRVLDILAVLNSSFEFLLPHLLSGSKIIVPL